MSDWILRAAREGAKAVGERDAGTSARLMRQVEEALGQLRPDETEWLALAVTNTAIAQRFDEDTKTQTQTTNDATMEIWDV